MDKLIIFYHETDEKLTTWMAKNGILLLEIPYWDCNEDKIEKYISNIITSYPT